jgi:hypothetical protein
MRHRIKGQGSDNHHQDLAAYPASIALYDILIDLHLLILLASLRE